MITTTKITFKLKIYLKLQNKYEHKLKISANSIRKKKIMKNLSYLNKAKKYILRIFFGNCFFFTTSELKTFSENNAKQEIDIQLFVISQQLPISFSFIEYVLV